jgi:maltose-binding protein MalE
MPVQAYYMGALKRAVDFAVFGKKTPKQALDDATTETQAELDLVLRGG